MNAIPETSSKFRRLSASLRTPAVIVHCDWSISEKRRWMAQARRTEGKYFASAPEPVGNLKDPNLPEAPFLTRVQRKRGNQAALIGFDFPIGLPHTYADKVEAKDFPSFLGGLGAESQFFEVCRKASEISLDRPFYPFAPGQRLQEHLTRALGIQFQQLLRACDRANDTRTDASALFWTLGAKQAGKAAIVGWRDVLAPALRANEIRIWPFHGPLDSLLRPGRTVVAETYPAQYYHSIFGNLNGPKTSQQARADVATRILKWAAIRVNSLALSNELIAAIQAGFPQGDDAFDALIGLFGMIDAIQNYSLVLEPKDETIRQIEGWILGQPAN